MNDNGVAPVLTRSFGKRVAAKLRNNVAYFLTT